MQSKVFVITLTRDAASNSAQYLALLINNSKKLYF